MLLSYGVREKGLEDVICGKRIGFRLPGGKAVGEEKRQKMMGLVVPLHHVIRAPFAFIGGKARNSACFAGAVTTGFIR